MMTSPTKTEILDVGAIKRDFPILQQKPGKKRLIYLDNGATTQKPRTVIGAMTKFYEDDNANVHRGIHHLSVLATMTYERAHEVVASFIGAAKEEIVFTSGATGAINGLAHSLGKTLRPGDEIVLTVMEHHSNLIPWQQLAREKDLILKYITLTDDYRLDMNKAQKLIGPKTKIVSVVHMSNVLGTINPVTELATMAHRVGAVLVVDAAQSIAHIPINVEELDCDFLAFSGHKIGGPTGIGVLYGKKRLLEQLPPFAFGGGMVKEVTLEQTTWNDLPWKFEAGTPPIAEAVGLLAIVEYLNGLDMQQVAAQSRTLTREGLQKLSAISGVKIIGPANSTDRGPIFSFTIKGIHPHDVSELLDREGIAVRAGHHCAKPLFAAVGEHSAVRASFYIYNDFQDIAALAEGIKKTQAKFK